MTMSTDHRPLGALERDVEASRRRLEIALNDVSSQLSIDGVVSSVKRQYGGDLSQTADRIVAKAKNNPLPTALIGAGLAWLLLGDGGPDSRKIARTARHGAARVKHGTEHMVDRTVHGAEDMADRARHGAEHLADRARHGAENLADRAREGAGQVAGSARAAAHKGEQTARDASARVASAAHAVRHDIHGRPIASGREFDDHEGLADKARHAISDAGEAVSDRMHSVSDTAHDLAHDAREQWRETRAQSAEALHYARDEVVHAYRTNPVVLGLGVAAIGSLIGVLLPNSRQEDAVFAEHAHNLRDKVEEAANEAIGEAEHKAEEAIDKAEKTVEEAAQKAESKASGGDSSKAKDQDDKSTKGGGGSSSSGSKSTNQSGPKEKASANA